MPKEYVNGSQAPDFPGDFIPASYVRVSWARDTRVMLTTNLVVEMDEEPPDSTVVRLDRPQVNDLIRVLRRARDQAYGGDE